MSVYLRSPYSTCSRLRYTVRTFRFSHAAGLGTQYGHHFSHAAGLGTRYGPFISHMQPASVQGTDLSILKCSRPRYKVRNFRFSHAAGLGKRYGHFVSHMQPPSVQGTDRSFLTCSRPTNRECETLSDGPTCSTFQWR